MKSIFMKNINLIIVFAILMVIVSAGFFAYRGLNSETSVFPVETMSIADEKVDNVQGTDFVKSIEVEGGMYYFDPSEIRVKAGEKVTITFRNVEGMHDFVIDELGVRTEQIKAGETETVEFTPENPGTYEFYCSVGNHRAMGMK